VNLVVSWDVPFHRKGIFSDGLVPHRIYREWPGRENGCGSKLAEKGVR
jgi:hypothetical protein